MTIKLIATEAGNSPVENITYNALHLTEILGLDIPVTKGSTTPIKRTPNFATKAQGKGGLGGYKFNKKKIKTIAVEGEACDVMYKAIKTNKTQF